MIKYIIATVLALALGAGIWYWSSSDGEEPAAAKALPPPPPVESRLQPDADTDADDGSADTEAMAEAPATDYSADLVAAPQTLDGSDQRFTAAVADMTAAAAAWFVPSEQIRKWVVTVDLMAEGSIPSRNRALKVPVKRFAASRVGDTEVWQLDPKNYQRLDQVVDTLTAVEPERMAAYYRAWQPLFEQGYSELGKRGDFHSRLELAIARSQSLAPLPANVKLKRPGAMYVYADRQLESAPDLDKLLWRMGPENLAKIQAYLEDLEPLL